MKSIRREKLRRIVQTKDGTMKAQWRTRANGKWRTGSVFPPTMRVPAQFVRDFFARKVV